MTTFYKTLNSLPSLVLESRVADTPAGQQPRNRNLAFDAVRLAASIMIVWPHALQSEQMQRWAPLGKFGTSFFTAASIYFMIAGVKSRPQRTLGEYARVRSTRLYVPFLVWCAIYLAFRDLGRLLVSGYPPVALDPMYLLSGTEWHLWFLPFILIASVVSYPLARLAVDPAAPRWGRNLLIGVMVLVGMVLAAAPSPIAENHNLESGDFWFSAYWALPSVCWGFALGLSDSLIDSLRRRGAAVALLAGAITVICAAIGVWAGPSLWQKNIAGTAWLVAALSLPQARWTQTIGRIAPLAFGLYLIHPLVIGIAMAAARVLHVPDGILTDLSYFALGVTGGLAASLLVSRSPRLRWLVP